MNHIYRVIFNRQTGTFQAVAETAKTPHKTNKSKLTEPFKAILTPISFAVSLILGLTAHASPTGGQVTAGQATIHQNGLTTNINQSSQNAAINWQSFNIAHNETVNFNQPNAGSVTLNRVIGNERSVIDGAMNANGKVFISNANGMLIGKDAKINVGSLVATTANISDDDLMNGRYQFTGEGAGNIENLGHISVPKGGVVALVAPIVKNGGTITAHEGNALLASAESFSITLPDNANFAYTLDKGTLQGLVDNGGAILADAGRVVLTAKGVDTVKKSLIKHSGNIEANTVQNKNGVIELLGDLDNSALNVSGSLKAEGKESGDGGFIETSSAQLNFDDSAVISTKSETGQTGTWLIDPKDFTVAPSGGDITGAKVSEGLQSNNVTLKSRDGAKEGKGDVIINDEISWNKGKLTLNAQNDIHINKTLNGTGTAKLALEYGQGTTNGGQSDYYLDKNTTLKDRTVKVNLPEGKNFSTKKGSNGQIVEFDVIHTMPEISSDGKAKDFDIQNIAFGKDMDLSYTENHNGFAGWGLKKKYQSGSDLLGGEKIHGLGHTVQNLTLDAPNQDIVGLFRKAEKAELRDLNLRNAKVKGQHYIGTLAGSLINSQVSNIHVNRSSILGAHNIGGIVGYVENNSGTNNQITNLHSNVKINASDGRSVGGAIGTVIGSGYEPTLTNINDITATGEIRVAGSGDVVGGTGGLIGTLKISNGGNKEDKIFVSNSSATGNVIAPNARGVGGLIGHIDNYGERQIVVQNSFATGNVEGYYETGGFIGATGKSTIANNYATGNVSGSSSGGLVGRLSRATIQNSYATGNLKAADSNNVLGGLVGYADQSQIKRSYATGNITADGKNITNNVSVTAGGLVGNNWDSDITESYATGNIHGTDFELTAGGLVGKHSGGSNIENSYATGDVSGLGWRLFLGGLIGNVGDRESTVSNTYATGKLTAPDEKNTHYQPNGLVGSHNYDSTKPLAGVSDSYFNKETVGTDKDFAGGKALTTAEMQNKASFANWDFDDIWYINDGEIPKLHAHKKGTISINPVVTPPITQPSNPTNNKTDLGIQANNLNKVYDGKSVATESDLRAIATQNGYTDIVTISGLKNGDSVSKLGTLRYDGTGNTWQNAKNAGSYTIMPSGLTGGQDYEIKYGEGKLTIDKRPVEAILRGQKTYNTHNQAEIDGQTRFNQNGLIDDTVKFTGSVTLAGKDAGNHNIVDSSKVQITGDGAENYELKSVTGVWKINPQSVDATAIGSKVYDDSAVANIDDTTRVSFSRNAEGVYESDLDKVKLSGSVTLKGKDVGAHTIQDFNNATLTGEAAKNYTLKNLVGRWNITPAPVVITGKSLTLKGNREYDATNNAYAKDVDMQSLNEQLYDSDKGKIKIEGIGKLEDIHVGEQALKDKDTLALTGDAAKNYEIQVSGSKWEITPYTFSLRGNKTYDATTHADAKDVDQRYLDVFLFPNDKGKIQLKGTGSIVAANATSLDKPHKLADKGSLRLASETHPELAKNYQINFDDSGWTIAKRKITATGEKVYNADNRIDAKDLKPSETDIAPDDRDKGADALRIASGTALLNTKHVHQNGSRITETGTLKLSGSLADNYELTSGGYVKIQPAVLTVKAVSDTKTYDGTTASNKTPIVSGLQGADKLIGVKQEFLYKDVLGDGQSLLKVDHFKVEDFNNGKNYKVVTESTKGTINPKVITTKFNKVYDGTELINHYHIDREAFHQQLINSDIESVQLVGSGELDNKNSGNRLLKQNRFTLFGKESNNYQIDMKNSQFRIDKRPISLVVRKYADNSTRFDWNPASLDNADNEVELLNVIKNQNNFDEINSFSIEGFSLETTSPKAGTYTGKDVTIKTPIKIKNDNYIFDLGNSSGILVQVAQDSNDFDFNTNEGQIVVREVEHEDDFFFGYTDKLGTLDLGWFGKHNIVNYRGFQISKPTEKTLLDGTTELTLPIFNTLDATLEIQVFDENGQIIDRQYADPHLLTTDVVDWFSESISDLNKEGLETSAVSTETEVKVKVPKGGKIKFTYNSPYAKRNNLAEPLYDLLTEALSSDDASEPQEKELKRIIRDSLSDEVIQPLIDALGVGSLESLARVDLQKIDFAQTKKALENISDKIIEQLKETISVDTGLKIAVGVALENLNSVKIAKDFAEGTTKFLNLLSGTINYTRDLSKYDQEIRH